MCRGRGCFASSMQDALEHLALMFCRTSARKWQFCSEHIHTTSGWNADNTWKLANNEISNEGRERDKHYDPTSLTQLLADTGIQ
jgi:hypothetical protein